MVVVNIVPKVDILASRGCIVIVVPLTNGPFSTFPQTLYVFGFKPSLLALFSSLHENDMEQHSSSMHAFANILVLMGLNVLPAIIYLRQGGS